MILAHKNTIKPQLGAFFSFVRIPVMQSKIKQKKGLFRLVLLGYVCVVISCQEKETTFFRNEGLEFGTSYLIMYEYHKDLHGQLKDKFTAFNASLSTYQKESVISQVNQNRQVELDDYFVRVFEKAIEVSQKTNGAFDMTVAPLVNAWGFGFSKRDSVTPELVDSLLPLVGMEKVKLVKHQIVKDKPGIMLDASAIAKGYAVDVMADFLEEQGIHNYLVEIGGEIRVSGVNMRGSSWRVGIDKPIDDPKVLNRELQEIVELTQGSLASSGNYRNFYIKDGKKYAHTIDPKTGYPIEHELLSASVVAADCMTADAYATAFMVMGLKQSRALVESNEELEAYFIYRDENDSLSVYATPGFERLIAK
jgi:thiamine biosynthesis lipoprotein